MHTAKRCFLPTKNRVSRLPMKSLASGILIQHQEALWATRRCLNYFLQKWNLENHCMRAVAGLKGIEAYILLMHCVKHSSNFFVCKWRALQIEQYNLLFSRRHLTPYTYNDTTLKVGVRYFP